MQAERPPESRVWSRRTLRRRLILFWVILTLAAFGAVLLVLAATGLFSNADRRLQRELEVQLQATDTMLQQELDRLTARSLSLSETVSREIENQLLGSGLTFGDLNDNSPQLLALQQALYAPVRATLQMSSCSGAYVVLDVTANTAVAAADTSRSGIYLRSVNLTGANPVDPDITFFRGIPEVARKKQVELHNRWDLEFDTGRVPGYADLVTRSLSRPADHYYWTDRVALGDTWEEGLLLCVPVVGNSRRIYGICGVDISALYFRLAVPALDTGFGPVTAVLAPLENGQLMLQKGLIGGVRGNYLDRPENLTVHQGRSFYTYIDPAARRGYVGVQQPVSISLDDSEHRQWVVALLLPESSYRSYAAASRTRLVVSCAAVLLILVAVSALLYRRFLRSVGSGAFSTAGPDEGAEELRDFVCSRAPGRLFDGREPPPEIAAVLDRFAGRCSRLTGTGRALLGLLAQGCPAEELGRRLGLSPRQARRELDELCGELGLSCMDDLLLYVDFFQHSGQLDRLL